MLKIMAGVRGNGRAASSKKKRNSVSATGSIEAACRTQRRAPVA